MRRIVLKLVRLYQVLSRTATTPFVFGAFSGCRQWPTCSDFACEAIAQDGVVRGGARALRRFVRCNPITSPNP